MILCEIAPVEIGNIADRNQTSEICRISLAGGYKCNKEFIATGDIGREWLLCDLFISSAAHIHVLLINKKVMVDLKLETQERNWKHRVRFAENPKLPVTLLRNALNLVFSPFSVALKEKPRERKQNLELKDALIVSL
jgi:hypothetical protein